MSSPDFIFISPLEDSLLPEIITPEDLCKEDNNSFISVSFFLSFSFISSNSLFIVIKYTLTAEGKKLVSDLKDFKEHFITINKELDEIKEKERKKETEINELLSSLQRSSGVIISGSKLSSKGDMNIKSGLDNDEQIKSYKNAKGKNI